METGCGFAVANASGQIVPRIGLKMGLRVEITITCDGDRCHSRYPNTISGAINEKKKQVAQFAKVDGWVFDSKYWWCSVELEYVDTKIIKTIDNREKMVTNNG